MEKLNLQYKIIDEKEIEGFLKEIYHFPPTNSFIEKYQIDEAEIRYNLISFLAFKEDFEVCKKCKGLKKCPKGAVGLKKELEIDYYNTIACVNVPCVYLKELQDLEKGYTRRDFPQDELYLKNNGKVDIVPYPERHELSNYLGRIKTGKIDNGVYIYGPLGVGKSYLVKCLCNSLVREGLKVAFIDVRVFCDFIRTLVKEAGNEAFNDYINMIKKSDVVVLDNFGNESVSEWTRDSVLYEIIDYRYRNKLVRTIITTNYSFSELNKIYCVDRGIKGTRFITLVESFFKQIRLDGVNRRGGNI